jgi:hypothetical protein
MKIHEIISESKLDKPTPSVAELVKKHNVSSSHIKTQLAKGTKVELEHTSDRKVAREIALDHIGEDPNYYTKLKKMEEAISRDELISKMSRKQKTRMLDAIFAYLDKAVKSDPEKDVKKHAFQLGQEVNLADVGLTTRMLSKQYSQQTGIPETYNRNANK